MEIADLKTKLATAKKEAISEERARCLGIIATGNTLNISQDSVTKMIDKGRALEDVKDIFTDMAEMFGKSSEINIQSTLVPTTQQINTKEPENPFSFIEQMDSVLDSIKPRV